MYSVFFKLNPLDSDAYGRQRLSPLESALTENSPVTPLESALTIYMEGGVPWLGKPVFFDLPTR